MKKKKLTNIQKVLLFAYRSNRGITWAMASMIKTVSPWNAYSTVMRIKGLGLLAKSSYYKNRFVITEAGIEKLRKARLIPH